MWNPAHNLREGQRLEDLKTKGGPWEYSDTFRDVHTAFKWNMSPEEFWSRSFAERAIMIAYLRSTGKMTEWEDNKSND
jgi:hypothetical protein